MNVWGCGVPTLGKDDSRETQYAALRTRATARTAMDAPTRNAPKTTTGSTFVTTGATRMANGVAETQTLLEDDPRNPYKGYTMVVSMCSTSVGRLFV